MEKRGTSEKNSYWNELIGKEVRLMITDVPYPRPRDGVVMDVDDTHIWLKMEYGTKEEIKPFSRVSVKRVDLR